ncbi:type VII secretion-associated protein [Corynebacterium mustelae]|uniref:Type VII secretion-associated protein n=1 Tax=Corynebacterium mustelae TaxID=571915 RepID=A0A0G3GUP5_9CORY|nr:type VII secretion-associated protein [Corynebacterium mustelae]AKK04874.1 type VII secretion-associated protein [Corynebacterium mustelae]
MTHIRPELETYDLIITVLDTASIFEGKETAYRYDLPAAGIRDGWAMPAIIEQTQKLLNPGWPDVTIGIDAATDVTEQLIRALACEGASATAIDDFMEEPLPDGIPGPVVDLGVQPPTTMFPPQRLVPSAAESKSRRQSKLTVYGLYAAMVLVVVGVCLVSWWAVSTDQSAAVPPAPAADSARETAASQRITPATVPPEAPTTRYEYGHVALRLPAGFRVEDGPKPGLFRAIGTDENLRVLVAIDPLFDADPAAVVTELETLIANEEVMTKVKPLGIGRGPEIGYQETPGDGSGVLWVAWVDGEHLFSVGCQTRNGVWTIPQKSICRQAAESLEILTTPTSGGV